VLIFAVLGVIWNFAKPYLNEWAAQRRLTRLLETVEAGVGGTMQAYVDAVKAASADGKLTEEEAKIAKDMARGFIISFAKAQGIDIIRDYGHDALGWLIEYTLGKLKMDNAMLKAVAAPLSASGSPPIPELAPGMPAGTGAVSG
jgi:hypothetical protein